MCVCVHAFIRRTNSPSDYFSGFQPRTAPQLCRSANNTKNPSRKTHTCIYTLRMEKVRNSHRPSSHYSIGGLCVLVHVAKLLAQWWSIEHHWQMKRPLLLQIVGRVWSRLCRLVLPRHKECIHTHTHAHSCTHHGKVHGDPAELLDVCIKCVWPINCRSSLISLFLQCISHSLSLKQRER